MPRLVPAAAQALLLLAATSLPTAAAIAGGALIPDSLALDAPVPVSHAGSSSTQARKNRVIIAHAVIGTLVFLVFMPAAILSGRWLRRHRRWLWVHVAFNVLSAAGVITAFGVGYYRVQGYTHWSTVHQRMGLALLLLVLLQALLGLAAHRTKTSALPHPRPTLSRATSPLRLLHILTGVTIASLGFAQLHTGIPLWNKFIARSLIHLPSWLYGLLWAVAGLEIAAYLGGWAWEAVALRKADAHGGRVERRGSGEALVGASPGGGTGSPASVDSGMQEVGSAGAPRTAV